MKKIPIFLLSIFFAVNVFAVSAFTSDEFGAVDIHGFISQGYLDSDDHKYLLADTDDGTFEFNEMGISFSTKINANLRIGMQLLSKDLGDIGNDDVEIDWAYADYRYRNWLGIRVGKIKQPGGIYNQARDVDSARTCILLPASIYGEQFREASLTSKGVGFYGMLPGNLDYQVVYGVPNIHSEGGLLQFIEQEYPDMRIGDVDADAGFIGELFWNTPLEGLRVGYTYNEAEFDMNVDEMYLNRFQVQAYAEADQGLLPGTLDGDPSMAALPDVAWYDMDIIATVELESNLFSVEYIYENFMISAEFRSLKLEDGLSNNDGEDYYVMTTYRFTDWFELGLYYSARYIDKDDRDGKDAKASYDAWLAAGGPVITAPVPPTDSLQYKEKAYLKDFALSTRFDVNEYWTVKFEFHLMDGLNGVDFSESDNPADPDPDWTLFAAKVSYSF